MNNNQKPNLDISGKTKNKRSLSDIMSEMMCKLLKNPSYLDTRVKNMWL